MRAISGAGDGDGDVARTDDRKGHPPVRFSKKLAEGHGAVYLCIHEELPDLKKVHLKQMPPRVFAVSGLGLIAGGIVKLAIHPSASTTTSAWNVGVTTNGIALSSTF